MTLHDSAIRSVQANDFGRLSALIRNTLLVSNCADYDLHIIHNLSQQYSEVGLRRMAARWRTYVHDEDDAIGGTISLDLDTIHCFFVAPDRQGQGVGTSLLTYAEERAAEAGISKLKVGASITAVGFYRHWGYRPVSRQPDSAYGEIYWMVKTI